jgi:membrane-bound metal-dependent hydrolase YbcI (DUF457 family)
MPFTPFHWGPALLLGLALFTVFDLPALLISSVIVDVEPFYALRFGRSLPLHGFFHSYMGASILGVLVAFVMYPLRGLSNMIMTRFGLSQESSFKKILFTSLFGVYSHVFLDSFLYSEMTPFYPLPANPFIHVVSIYVRYSFIYGFCGVTFLFSLPLYAYRILRKR